MEKLKVQISEIEGMSIKIPTEFTGYTFGKFYDQMVAIGKAMPSNPLGIVTKETPERFKMPYWQDEAQCIELVKVWKDKGRDAGIKWIKDNKDWDLDKHELSRISGLIASLRSKYKQELSKDGY